MRKPYATPEQYVDWETRILKRHAGNIAYMIMVMCHDCGVETRFDRHVLGNAHDELYAVKTVLDSRIRTYTVKLLLERLHVILGEELAAYDKREREGRIARKQLEAHHRRVKRQVE